MGELSAQFIRRKGKGGKRMRITKKMLRDYVTYKVAPGYYKNLNIQGLNYYKRKLAKDIVKGKRIKLTKKGKGGKNAEKSKRIFKKSSWK